MSKGARRSALNPVHLHTLITVVQTGSFAEAARELGYTSSAISQQIASLERTLKVRLFERETRSVRCTAAAELLAQTAVSVLASFDTLLSDIDKISKGLSGRLKIGSFPTANRTLLPRALAMYREKYPDITLELDESEPSSLVTSVMDRETDIVLVYDYDLVKQEWPSELKSVSLLKERLVLLCPTGRADLYGLGHLTLSRLREESWISTRDGTRGAECLRRLCGTRGGFEPRIGLKSNDYDAIHSFVEAGFGIALVPGLSHSESQHVRAVVLDDVDALRHVYILYRTDNLNPAIPFFIEAVSGALPCLRDSHPFLFIP